ncbi:MAG: U32 family peptidase, partial [Giesbergeria sp.]
FLVLNGIQTQSARVHNLIDELPRMQRMGVAVARISPQAQHTGEVLALFDAVRRGTLAPQDARAQLQPLVPDQSCNGYWHGQPGLDLVETEAMAAA